MTVKDFFNRFGGYVGTIKIVFEDKTFDYLNSSVTILDFGNFSVTMAKTSKEGVLLKVTN